MTDTAEQAAEKAKLSRLQQDSANLVDGLRKYVTLAASATARLQQENADLRGALHDHEQMLDQKDKENADLREQLAERRRKTLLGAARALEFRDFETCDIDRPGVFVCVRQLRCMADQPAEAEQEGKSDGKANSQA